VDLKMSVAVSLTDRQSGDHALWAVRESGGELLALDEDQILLAGRALGRLGICVEPASATAFAGAMIRPDLEPPIVCVLTGAGARWPQTFEVDDALPIVRTPEDLAHAIGYPPSTSRVKP
jgi:threonine synthase